MRGDDRRVDLGDIVQSGEPQLRVEDADGPLADQRVRFARPGYQSVGRMREFTLDHEGFWDGPDLREGDAIWIEGDEDLLPFRTVLSGEGPWAILIPEGQLDLQVKAGDGQLIVPRLLLGDLDLPVKDVRRLRGL